MRPFPHMIGRLCTWIVVRHVAFTHVSPPAQSCVEAHVTVSDDVEKCWLDEEASQRKQGPTSVRVQVMPCAPQNSVPPVRHSVPEQNASEEEEYPMIPIDECELSQYCSACPSVSRHCGAWVTCPFTQQYPMTAEDELEDRLLNVTLLNELLVEKEDCDDLLDDGTADVLLDDGGPGRQRTHGNALVVTQT